MKPTGIILIILAGLMLSACSVKPRAIQEGVDNCAFCKMTVMEKQYAAEIVTNTGKVFVFDDAKCMKIFIKENTIPREDMQLILISDFNNPDRLLPADEAILFTSDALRTPMNGKTVALSDSNALKQLQSSMEGTSTSVHAWLQ